mgnify:CR=1 FL=1|jgi:ribose/xylose/arabinose/galactoside ABC-type transport system permease subunit
MKKVIISTLLSRNGFLCIVIIALGIILSFLSPYFLEVSNLLSMTQFGALLALVGMGQTLVIIGGRGGIDLSVGSIVSFSGVLLALLYNGGLNIWLACLAAVIIGGLLGTLNGFLVSSLSMPPLIVTLGTSYIFSSLSLVLTKGVPVSGLPASFRFIGQTQLFGIPTQIIIIVIPVFIILNWMIKNTVFGRSIYMIGVNDRAGRLVGINVKKVRVVLYTISGLLSGFGAIIMTSWLMAAKPDIGTGYDTQAITVAVLGGASMFGGEGSLFGTILAVLIITMISNGLQLANINTVWQLAVLGILLLVSIMINNLFEQRK